MVGSAISRTFHAISIGSASVDHLRGLEKYLMLRAPDLGRDAIDRHVPLPAADEAGDAIPDRRGALVGIHGRSRQ